MRIIGGRWGGRRLSAPSGRGTRPTSDRVREALFSVLEGRGLIDGANVLDLFAGSGALMLEAMSRGAAMAVAVESDRRACRTLLANVASLGAESNVVIMPLRVERAVSQLASRAPFDVAFVDPPYARLTAPDFAPLLRQVVHDLLADAGVLVLEHAHRDRPPVLDHCEQESSRRYGDTALTFYHRRRDPGFAVNAANSKATDSGGKS